jgi:hypothetical protein
MQIISILKCLIKRDVWTKLFFPFIGIASLIWFLIRVIPKPSRASYPCMRVAAPLASSFIMYVISLIGSIAAFKYAKIKFKDNRYISGILALIVFLSLGTWFVFDSAEPAKALIVQDLPANEPMGVGQGIFPGRVVWSWNPDATNEDCDPYESGNTWYNQGNYDQAVVDEMLSDVIQDLTGQTSDSEAWKAIFKYHNNNVRSKGVVNYSSGEKIFIKINATSAWGGQFDPDDLSDVDHPWGDDYDFISETSPAIVMAVLKQLVNVVGVAESDIYVGDPMKHIYKHNYDYWHAEFPDVHYLDHDDYSNLGREQAIKGTTTKIYYSDNGTILRPQIWSGPGGDEPIHNDNLYQIYEDAEYLINLPMLKGHKRAGMTMFAKNHFGSHTRDDASHLHNGLIAPTEMENGIDRPGYGLYRVQVDLMAHSILGKKNLVYIMDALWATDYELDRPLKWQMAPFNNDWMSSIFASFDPVSIESVGHDFLRSEFTPERGAGTYVQMEGVDDYLHQAADSSNWPDDIIYDPDSTGVLFASLGIHEHWNNAIDKQYSRNLSDTSKGIELIKSYELSAIALNKPIPKTFQLGQNYPNPFNPNTVIPYYLDKPAQVELTVYNMLGKKMETLVQDFQGVGNYKIKWNGGNHSSGFYIYRLTIRSNDSRQIFERKMLLMK